VADALGQSLPIAVGVMVSPLPIVAVVLMLVSGSARANAIAFTLAWFATIGVLLLLLAVRQWQGRPRGDAEATTPAWMAAVDAFTPVKAAGLAALLGGVNPKNLLLAVSGGAAIAGEAGADRGASVGAAIAVAFIASIGVSPPVVVGAKLIGDGIVVL